VRSCRTPERSTVGTHFNALADRYFGVEGQLYYYLGLLYFQIRGVQKSEGAFEKALEFTAKGPVANQQTVEIHLEYADFILRKREKEACCCSQALSRWLASFRVCHKSWGYLFKCV